MEWEEIYNKVLKKVCEENAKKFRNIVEIDDQELISKMVVNENASPESLWNLKLPDGSTEQDYKRFCEFIYNYIGLDIYDYLPRMFREFTKKEFSNFKKE